jgi:hypothetical protein
MPARWVWAQSILPGLLSVALFSCNGGSSDSPAPSSTIPQSPVAAGLLWRTPTDLIRSQTDGSAQVMLVNTPGFDPFGTVVSGATVVYHVTAPPVPPLTFGLNDIWQVQTNGTGRQVVVATADAENVRDVFFPWVVYERGVYSQGTLTSSAIRSARLDGPAQATLGANAIYRAHVGERTVMEQIVQTGGGGSFSILADGTDMRPLTDVPPRPGGVTFRTPVSAIGNTVLFHESFFPENNQNILAVPVTGGSVTPLTQGGDYQAVSVIVGSRLVYQRCPLIPNPVSGGPSPIAGPCDLYSTLTDGSGTVPLTTHPDAESVQGAIGSQVLFRRNSNTGDALYSIPAGGGTEAFLINLAQNEFVTLIVGDRAVLRRATGLWSIRADGSGLRQLTNDASDSPTGSAGSYVCFQRGPFSLPDLWCVLADGSGAATHVAQGAFFVSGL